MSTEEGEKETSVETIGAGEQKEGNPPPLEMGNGQGKGYSSSLSSVVEAGELLTPAVGAEHPELGACKTQQPSDSGGGDEVSASAPSESPPNGDRNYNDDEQIPPAVTEADRKGDAEEELPLTTELEEDSPVSGNKFEAEGDAGAVEKNAVDNPETATEKKAEVTNSTSVLDCTVARVENWADASDSPKHEKKKEDSPGTPEKEIAYSKDDGSEEGQEEALDEDENKNSPAYIPKVGNFYMHDVRGSEEKDDESKEGNKGRSRADRDKWRHDLFDERRQAPKRGDELVKRYGTNIRGDHESAKKGNETRDKREIDFPAKRSGNLGRTKAAVSRVRGKGRPHAAVKTVVRAGRRREESSTESGSNEEPIPPPRASQNRRAEGSTKGRDERAVRATSSAKVKNGDDEEDVEENVAPRRSIHSRITRINRGGQDDGGGRDRVVDRRPTHSPERNQRGTGSGRRREELKKALPPTVSRNNGRRGGGNGGRGDYTPPYSGASYEGRGVGVRGRRGREDIYPADRGQRSIDRYEDSSAAEYQSGGKRYTSQRGNYPLPPQRGPSDRGGRYRESADDYYESSSTNNNRRSYGHREGGRYPPPTDTNYQQSPQQRRPTQRGGRPPAYQSSTRGYEDNRRTQYSSHQPASYGQERHDSARSQCPSHQQPPPQYSQYQYNYSPRTGINTTTSRQQTTTHSYQQPAGGPSNSSYQLAFPPLGAVTPSQSASAQSSHQHHHAHGQPMVKSTSQQQQQHHPPRHQVQQSHNYQHPRQPTDAVYFDAQQQHPLNPPPAREKRRLQIIPPS